MACRRLEALIYLAVGVEVLGVLVCVLGEPELVVLAGLGREGRHLAERTHGVVIVGRRAEKVRPVHEVTVGERNLRLEGPVDGEEPVDLLRGMYMSTPLHPQLEWRNSVRFERPLSPASGGRGRSGRGPSSPPGASRP